MMDVRRFIASVIMAFVMVFSVLVLVPATPAGATMAQRKVVALDWAESQAGKWYCYGGTGPGCYDCSGLVMEAWRHAGIAIPRTTSEMLGNWRFHRIAARDRQRGDLVFWGNYHVEFVTRRASFGAQQTGTRIGYHGLWGSPTFWRVH